MTKFKIHEISGVDKPAQEGALVMIMKRDGSDDAGEMDPVIKRTFTADDRKRLAASGAAMPSGAFPIENREDLRNAVQGIGRAKDDIAARAHIVRRAKALGAENELPDGWSAASEDDADENEVDKAIKAMIAKGAAIRKSGGDGVVGSASYGAPPIGVGQAHPGWPGGLASQPGVSTKPEGRAQIGRPPVTGTPGDEDDPDADDNDAAPAWLSQGGDWAEKRVRAGAELQRRARRVAKREGVSEHVAYHRVLGSPAGRALYGATR
ncbi:MAG: hypothetical protein ACHP7N_11305 [Caulobacterales bacterium]